MGLPRSASTDRALLKDIGVHVHDYLVAVAAVHGFDAVFREALGDGTQRIGSTFGDGNTRQQRFS
jgi:hypothetical protein